MFCCGRYEVSICGTVYKITAHPREKERDLMNDCLSMRLCQIVKRIPPPLKATTDTRFVRVRES